MMGRIVVAMVCARIRLVFFFFATRRGGGFSEWSLMISEVGSNGELQKCSCGEDVGNDRASWNVFSPAETITMLFSMAVFWDDDCMMAGLSRIAESRALSRLVSGICTKAEARR
jgi:hypothetical protein